jgi:hypothetical protein
MIDTSMALRAAGHMCLRPKRWNPIDSRTEIAVARTR